MAVYAVDADRMASNLDGRLIKPKALLVELLSCTKPVLPFGLRKITGNVRSIIKNFMKIKQVNPHVFMQSLFPC
jgi:hypothetical protein